MTMIFHDYYVPIRNHWIYSTTALLTTFLACTIAWVFFRAPNLDSAHHLIMSMFHMPAIPQEWLVKWGSLGKWLIQQGYADHQTKPLIKGIHFLWISLLLAFVFLAPNTQEIFQKYKISISEPIFKTKHAIQWKANNIWLAIMVFVAIFAILNISELSEFIYFQF